MMDLIFLLCCNIIPNSLFMGERFSAERLSSISAALDHLEDQCVAVIAGQTLAHTDAGAQAGQGDEIEQAFRNDAMEVASLGAEYARATLAAVHEARSRIRRRVYGVCTKCSQNIPLARLAEVPYAANCRDCQQRSEDDERRRRIGAQYSASAGTYEEVWRSAHGDRTPKGDY